MKSKIRKTFEILAPGSSLKRRVAYSLAIVRLILGPVIFLTYGLPLHDGWNRQPHRKPGCACDNPGRADLR